MFRHDAPRYCGDAGHRVYRAALASGQSKKPQILGQRGVPLEVRGLPHQAKLLSDLLPRERGLSRAARC